MFKNKKSLFLIIFLNLCMFIYFYYLSIRFPIFGSDYISSSENLVKSTLTLDKLKEIYFAIIKESYWNLRIGNLLSILLSFFSREYFAVVISFTNILFINLIFFYSFSRFPNIYKTKETLKDMLVIIFIFMIYVLISTNFLNTSIWKSGSLNHLFGNVILLILFIPYYLLFYSKQVFKNNIFVLIFVTFIYFVFFINSYTSVPLFLLMMILSVLIFYLKNKKVEKWSIFGIISGLCGYIFLLKNGNQLKQNVSEGNILLVILEKYYETFIKINNILKIETYFILFISLFLIFILQAFYKKRYFLFKNIIFIKISILTALYLLSVFLFSLGNYLPERALILNIFFIICILCVLIKYIQRFLLKKLNNKNFFILIFTMLILLVYPTYKKIILINKEVLLFKKTNDEIIKSLQLAKKVDYTKKVYVEVPNNFKFHSCLVKNNSWCGTSILRYYSIADNIGFIPVNKNDSELKVRVEK